MYGKNETKSCKDLTPVAPTPSSKDITPNKPTSSY